MNKFQYHLLSQNLWSEHMHTKLEEEQDYEFLILPLANFSFTKAVLSLCELTSAGLYRESNRNTQKRCGVPCTDQLACPVTSSPKIMMCS